MSIPSQMVESSNLYEHKVFLPLHSFFQPKSREGRCEENKLKGVKDNNKT